MPNVDEIAAFALALDRKDRAELYALLSESLEGEELPRAEWEAAWGAEAHRRLQEIREGKVKGIPGDEVFRRARALLDS